VLKGSLHLAGKCESAHTLPDPGVLAFQHHLTSARGDRHEVRRVHHTNRRGDGDRNSRSARLAPTLGVTCA
jgi:hypothetical protein